MKKILLTLLIAAGITATAQVKIGDNPTNVGTSSSLELESTNRALLLPRVANTAAIASPVNGMMIYDISVNCFRSYENNSWSICWGSVGVGTITSITCASVVNLGTLTQNTPASSVTASIPYTGGNGGSHMGQVVTSTGVTGLTATLTAGSFATGAGSLTYTITGTPLTSGIAFFDIIIGGRSCLLSINVNIPVCPIPTIICSSNTTAISTLGSVNFTSTPSVGTTTWTQISGPATVSGLGTANNVTATGFTSIGTYVIRAQTTQPASASCSGTPTSTSCDTTINVTTPVCTPSGTCPFFLSIVGSSNGCGGSSLSGGGPNQCQVGWGLQNNCSVSLSGFGTVAFSGFVIGNSYRITSNANIFGGNPGNNASGTVTIATSPNVYGKSSSGNAGFTGWSESFDFVATTTTINFTTSASLNGAFLSSSNASINYNVVPLVCN
jgi:hypothetical protein